VVAAVKTCTTLRLKPLTGETAQVDVGGLPAVAAVVDAQIVDVSVVPDGHRFGVDPETGLLHVEGKIVAPEVRIEP
jgi:hypothetical protein